ncbi:MAG: DNA-directed RNA polymerase [Candidatus Woesearchaeota archaeon]
MYYKTKVKDFVRVPPSSFGDNLNDGIIKELKKKYSGYISQELGFVVDVSSVEEVGAGLILPGDGSTHYTVTFSMIAFKPEMQEIVYGKVTNVADFGAFITIGPVEGMVHISQSMNDFVSFSKDGVLLGKNSKQTLKVGDIVRTRIIAVSYKDVNNPKIGLTMRQTGLGKEDWVDVPEQKDTKESKDSKEEKKSK